MILAVSDYADGEGPPPPALEIALNCRRWGTLPDDGGLRDQYARLMNQMNISLNVYDTCMAFNQALAQGKQTEFLEDNPASNRLIGMVRKLSMERGANA